MKLLSFSQVNHVAGGYHSAGDAVVGNTILFGTIGMFIGLPGGPEGMLGGAFLGGTFGALVGLAQATSHSGYYTPVYYSEPVYYEPVYYYEPVPVIYF